MITNELNPVDNKQVPFPKLMVYSNDDSLIVLFNQFGKGVNLKNGEYRTDWVTSSFTDYTGSITLKNSAP